MKQNGLRKAGIDDYEEIMDLMENDDHKKKVPLQWDQLQSLLKDPQCSLMVYQSEGRIVGIMAAHFLVPCLQ